jgi:hypothetical protein
MKIKNIKGPNTDPWLYHTILLALEAKQVTSVTFADISQAFDTAWVKALVYKLGKYGIKGDLLCWLTNYFSNRTQKVMIKDALSGIGHLHAGVPQGSVLGLSFGGIKL